MFYGDERPRERLLAVAAHYYHFEGRSPINDQNRALIAALREVVKIPIYWGNRNWHPLLADTVRQMQQDGIRRAIAFPTSAFGSYSGCRQYLENIQRARAEVGDGAPEIVKIPPFSGHPLFLEAMTDRVRAALAELPGARVVFTAHSVPVSMAESESLCASNWKRPRGSVAEALGVRDWKLVYQSRSGPPTQPWLGPDICDYLRESPQRHHHRPHRVPFGSHGSDLRSGHRSARRVRGTGHSYGARGHGRDPSRHHPHDRGTDRARTGAVRRHLLPGASAASVAGN